MAKKQALKEASKTALKPSRKNKKPEEAEIAEARAKGITVSNSQNKKQELCFEPFRFRVFLGLSPQIYVPIIYGILGLALLYYLFLDSGLRRALVQLEFYSLSGDASLYVNDKFHSNLLFSPKQHERSVLLPSGQMELRIEKDGMEPWILKYNFSANIWNSRWAPRRYTFQVKMTKTKQIETNYFWQEAWRAYLYRGLEGQKEISFDASHPYPWVLSEGLRAHFYSKNPEDALPESSFIEYASLQRPAYWSADIQKGFASTTNLYQWGDLLSAYSLAVQFVPKAFAKRRSMARSIHTNTSKTRSEQGHLELLGPRSLAVLVRSAAKRLNRLEPGAASFGASWSKGLDEGLLSLYRGQMQGPHQSLIEYWTTLLRQPREQLEQKQAASRANISETDALSFADFRFMAVPSSNFVVQEELVSNEQFARFWFSDYGQRWRKEQVQDQPAEASSLSQSILYDEDLHGAAWDWPPAASLSEWRRSPSLQGQPVRGITWLEAQAFADWLQEEMPQDGWKFSLPSRAEYQNLLQELAAIENGKDRKGVAELDFAIPDQPPAFSQQSINVLGIKGLGGVLWQWLGDDYLPYRASLGRLGSSDLRYKAVAGGSWLNALPIDQNTKDLWVDEFLRDGNELPAQADSRTLGGQFVGIRSPYTGFRLIAKRLLGPKNRSGSSDS